jgi:hypothetical protein
MTTGRNVLVVLCLFAMLITVGCGRSDLPELGTVHGKVTVDGKPAAGTLITFAPDKGAVAAGLIQADGSYELEYIDNIKGAQVGPATVVLIPSPGEPKPNDVIIPPKYRQPSELKVEIKSGDNTFDFDLKSQ